MTKFPTISTDEDFERYFNDDLWLICAEAICQRHNISFEVLTRPGQGEHVVFLGEDFVIKIYTPFRDGFRREKSGIEYANGKTSLPLPEILFQGEIEGFNYLVFKRLEGVLMTKEIWLGLDARRQITVVARLASGLKELHSREFQTAEFNWKQFIEKQAAEAVEKQRANGVNPQWIERLPEYLEESLPLLPTNFRNVFLHGDVHFGNLRLIKNNGQWRISGLFDFADSLSGFHEYEFLAVGVLMIQGQGELQREFFRAYGYKDREIDAELRRRLMLMTILYECADLRRYALRLKPEAVNFTLDELERAIWSFA
jgi:hygromycin-B 7''-O-kinase